MLFRNQKETAGNSTAGNFFKMRI